jgi:hypothetical protein
MARWLTPGQAIIGLLAIFLALSAADLFLTRHLVERGGGAVVESNPVANWWLINGGWLGLTAFKLGMALIIGTVALGLTWRSKRASELVLMFACGAQSAIVLHSVFLDRLLHVDETPFVSDLPRTENPQLILLGRKGVQKEIQLSETQQKALVQLTQEQTALKTAARQLGFEEREIAITELVERQRAFLDQLEPKQAQRLRQIAWQVRGLAAFVDGEIENALHITSEQRQTIRVLLAKSRENPQGLEKTKRFEFAREGKTETLRSQILAVLTAEQRGRWNEITGAPFRDDAPAFGVPPRKHLRGSW